MNETSFVIFLIFLFQENSYVSAIAIDQRLIGEPRW